MELGSNGGVAGSSSAFFCAIISADSSPENTAAILKKPGFLVPL
jgi:hypothetical protein